MASTSSRRQKCSYINCGNSLISTRCRMHYFPKDENRCRQWILNSGNARLEQLPPEKITLKQICSDHFTDNDYVNPLGDRKCLHKWAVPIPYQSANEQNPEQSPPELKVRTPTKTYRANFIPGTEPETFPEPSMSTSFSPKSPVVSPSTHTYLSELTNLPSTPIKRKKKSYSLINTLNNTIYQKNKLLQKKCKIIIRLKQHISKLLKQISDIKGTDIKSQFENINFASTFSKTLNSMQMFHNKKQKWKEDEKDLALRIYFKSPGTYTFLRDQLKIILPGKSTISGWIGNSSCLPGFNDDILLDIKRKISSMDEMGKYCTLIFDEMKIKKCLEYSKQFDKIEGYEDHGQGRRANKFGTQVLLFMARGIFSNWKIPLGYFVSGTSIKGSEISELIKEALHFMSSAGMKPLATVCDQGSNNRAALKSLAAGSNHFLYNGHKVWIIYDALHLVKNFRNNWLQSRFKFRDKIVSFQDIKDTYMLDASSTGGRCLMKITESHINPDSFQKMSCKLATQIFSNSVAAAIRTAIDTGQLKSSTANDTADFVQFMNNLFDCLNSKELYSKNPYSSAISQQRPLVRQTLEKGKEIVANMRKLFKKGEKIPPCFDGMSTTITSILEIYEFATTQNISFLLTNRLNQDPIENIFSVFRQKGGWNVNPSVRTFRCTFKMIAKKNFMKSSLSNCEHDCDEILTENVEELKEVNQIGTMLYSRTCSSSSTDSLNSTEDIENLPPSSSHATLQDCASNYFAGYLARKTILKFNCKNCRELLTTETNLTNKSQLLILNKTYKNPHIKEGLKSPGHIFYSIVKICLKIMKNILDKKPQKEFLLRYIERKIYKIKLISDFLLANNKCKDHITFALKLLIRCKIYKECSWKTSFAKTKTKRKRKLDILQNL